MIDVTLLAEGAFCMAAGAFLRFRKPRARMPRTTCGCGHSLAYHEPDGDGGGTICHDTEEGAEIRHPGSASVAGYEAVPCNCRQYTGPRIMDPGYIARQLTEGGNG